MKQPSWLTPTLFISVPIFLFCTVGIDILGWIGKALCNPYLGCDSGFFGYDGLMHFLGGAILVITILWLMKRYPAINFLEEKPYKNFIIFISMVMFVEVLWEIMEFVFDQVRIYIFHWNIHIEYLAQPSNADTIGDLTLSLIGTLVMATIFKWIDRRSI